MSDTRAKAPPATDNHITGNPNTAAGSPLAEAAPIIQSLARRLAERLRLQPCDREDLEQELWLHLLREWDGDDSACPATTPPPDEPHLFSGLENWRP